MIKQIILYIVLLNVCLVILPAQEVVTGLQSNYRITSAREKHLKTKVMRAAGDLELPFFDDFSGQSVFPDSSKWLDDFVFINNTYSDRQITAGVATFDALDNTGRLYPDASPSVFVSGRRSGRSARRK